MFRKRGVTFLLVGMLAVMPVIAGCSGGTTAQMEEYKAEGIAQMEAGDYGEAVDTFQAGLDLSVGLIRAEELDLTYYKALALYLSGDAQGALDVYDALIDFGEDGWETYYLRGSEYANEGRWSEAAADYAEAVAQDPDNPELCLNICVCMLENGMEDEMEPYVDTALTFEPETGREYYNMGLIYSMTGDDERARTCMEQAQSLGEDEAFLVLGRMSAQEGDRDEAASMYAVYVETHSDNAEALAQLGAYAVEDGEYAEAIDYLTRACETADEDLLGIVVTNLVAAYEYAGNFESAYETAGGYLADHTDEELEREYDFLATRVGVMPEEE